MFAAVTGVAFDLALKMLIVATAPAELPSLNCASAFNRYVSASLTAI